MMAAVRARSSPQLLGEHRAELLATLTSDKGEGRENPGPVSCWRS